MNEKVTIIIPVYKVEKYLNRCLESVIKQTYTNLEIILIDDGSPDKCYELCDSWKLKDSRIKVIHKENGGLSSARNAGLDIATGDFIAFVDSDDYIENKMIEIMLDAALRNKVKVVCCGRVRVSEKNKIEMFTLPREQRFSNEEAIRQLLIGGVIEEAAWDKLYKKEIFDNRRFPKGEINEDIVQTIKILGSCDSIIHVGKALYNYCENNGSITKSGYKEEKIVILKHLEQIKEYIEHKFPEMVYDYDVLESRYCQSTLYLLLDNKEVYNSYKEDYNKFYERFRKSFLKKSVQFQSNRKELIKGWLIFIRLYYPLHALKARISK